MRRLAQEVAEMIFLTGAFKTGEFKLKLHETNPNAPLSPLFMNLRTADNPKKGPLNSFDCDLIAVAIWETIDLNKLEFGAIAGLPNAADPFIEAMERRRLIPKNVRVIKLAKEETDKGRRIIPMPGFDYREGEVVLLIDDLVTKADSKIEAIKAIESEGCIVKDLVVLIDREQGGKNQLESAGYNLFTCMTISETLEYYKNQSKINLETYTRCLDYIRNN